MAESLVPARRITRDDPISRLACILYQEMVRLDPAVTPDEADPDWADLPERRREFYRLCVARLMVEPLLRAQVADQSAGSPTTT